MKNHNTPQLIKFNAYLKQHGWTPSEPIIVDDKIHRLSWSEDSDSNSGWYRTRMHNDVLFVYYGDWKNDSKRSWSSKDKRSLSKDEKAIYNMFADESKAAQQAAKVEAEAAAAIEVRSVWESAVPAEKSLSYLAAKQISTEGLRVRSVDGADVILAPLYNDQRHHVNLQQIWPDGHKRFWKSAQASGVFWSAVRLPSGGFDGDIAVAEGIATAATVAHISGITCVAAMNCGNLPKVAAILRELYPNARLLIAADDDNWNADGKVRLHDANMGLKKGHEAASGPRDLVIAPPRTGDGDRGTDWNDRYCKIGEVATKSMWDQALKVAEVEKRLSTLSDLEFQQNRPKLLESFKEAGLVLTEGDLDQRRETSQTFLRSMSMPVEGQKKSEVLLEICKSADLWHDCDGNGYATVKCGNHSDTMKIEGTGFKDWLYNRYREICPLEGPPGRELLRSFIESTSAQARRCSPRFAAHFRMGYDDVANCHWLDLGRPDWQMVKWDASGWGIAEPKTIKFARSNGKIDLPMPERNPLFNKLEPLWNILNISEADRPLIAGFLLCALFSGSPCFALSLYGGMGTAKSIGSAIIRRILDPHPAVSQTINARKGNDLGMTCLEQWIPVFENVSSLTPEIQDILCSLTTKLSDKRRILYTTNDTTSYTVRRPFIMNGINNAASRSDLAERTIPVALLPAPEGDARKTEEHIESKFLECQAHVLATLLDAAVASLAGRSAAETYLAQNKLDHRMADALQIITAGEEVLGFPMGSFIRRLKVVQREAGEDALEGNPVLAAIQNLLDESLGGSWSGTYGDVLAEMGRLDPDSHRSKYIPRDNTMLGNWLRRECGRLKRSYGITLGETRREVINGRKLRVFEIQLDKGLDGKQAA